MKNFQVKKSVYIYRLNTEIRLTILCLSGFELYSRWVPLTQGCALDLTAQDLASGDLKYYLGAPAGRLAVLVS